MKNDIKIGDKVELLRLELHNSNAVNFNVNIYFESSELGKIITILDIELDHIGDLAYKVQCNKGITYLRRGAFDLVKRNKYHISEFIENFNLGIKCNDLEQSRKVGAFLWKEVDINSWEPSYNCCFPIICWYATIGTHFDEINYFKYEYIEFENVIFEDVFENIDDKLDYLIPIIEKINKHYEG